MAPALKTVVVVRFLNITLAANLIVLSNDVSLNPGPAITLPARTKGLRIFHLNIHSLRYKLDELRLFCDKHKPHILALNETWLDQSFTDEELSLQGYNIMRRDRNRDGGGVAVYIAEHLNYSRLKVPNESTDRGLEAIWFELYYHRKQRKFWSVLSINHRTLMLLSLLTAWRKCLTSLQPMKLRLFCWETLTSIISLQTPRR